MYYLTEKCVTANDTERISGEAVRFLTDGSTDNHHTESDRESVFAQADLWNLQKHMKTIHVTDRFPRTWEGTW